MKPTETPPFAPARVGEVRPKAVRGGSSQPENETEEEAFYAAQEAALAELRAHHRNRPRRKQ